MEEHNDNILDLGPAGENGPSTLPQILHLAHKNYADFQLEVLQTRLKRHPFGLEEVTPQ